LDDDTCQPSINKRSQVVQTFAGGEPPGRAVNVLFAPAVIVSVLCDGCAGAVSVCHLRCYHYYSLLLLTVKLRFQQASWLLIYLAVKCTIQPRLLPGRLKEVRYLTSIGGAIDRGE